MAEMPRKPGRVEVTSPAPRELWWKLVHRDTDALVTQTPTWLDCLCDAWPLEDASRLYRFASGAELVVPMVRRRAWPGRLLAEESWPGWGVGGAVVPDGGTDDGADGAADRAPDGRADGAPSADQARLVFDDLAARPAVRVTVRFSPRVPSPSVWDAAVPEGFSSVERTSYLLDLAGGFEEAWMHRFHPAVRRGVRHAQRAEVAFEVDRTGRFVPQFEQLYDESVVRWAEQQHEPLALARWRRRRDEPPRLVAAVAERFGSDCAIWLATCAGRPAAAIVVLRHGTHAKYWRGAMDRDLAAPVHANHMLHRLAIEEACAAGCLLYDMGDARPGSSLARFKESFGAQPVSSRAYYRERLPITAADLRLRGAVKRLIGFRNA